MKLGMNTFTPAISRHNVYANSTTTYSSIPTGNNALRYEIMKNWRKEVTSTQRFPNDEDPLKTSSIALVEFIM